MTSCPDSSSKHVRLVLLVDLGRRLEDVLEDVGRLRASGRAWSGRGRTRCRRRPACGRRRSWRPGTSACRWRTSGRFPAAPTPPARSSNFHSVRGRRSFSRSSLIGSGCGGQVRLGVGQVRVQVVDDVQRPVHPPPVARVGADVGIDARLRGRGEAQLLRVARLEQPAGQRGSWPTAGRNCRAAAPGSWAARLGQEADLLQRPGLHDHEVVRHQVGVLEDELDRLAGLDDEPVLVERHLLGQVPTRITRTPSSPSSACGPLGLGRPAAARRGRRRIAGRRAPAGDVRSAAGVLRHVGDDHDRAAAAPRPWASRPRDALQGADGGGAVGVVPDEPGERRERLGFLAADGGQGGHRRAADDRRRSAAGRARTCCCAPGPSCLSCLKTRLAAGVEDLEGEALEPLAEVAVGAVVDDDRLDRQLGAQIDLPPRVVRVLLACASGRRRRKAPLVVAVDGPAGRRRRWPCSSARPCPGGRRCGRR